MSILPGNYIDSRYIGSIELCKGLILQSIDYEVSLSPAGASFTVATVPIKAVLRAAMMAIPDTILATTAVKIGLGTAANPDVYGLSTNLTAQDVGGIPAYAALAAATVIKVSAVDTSGDAAGTIGGTGQTVTVRLIYELPAFP